MGDLYALGAQITVPASQQMSKTFSGSGFVDRKLWRYDPAGTNTVFVQKAPINNHCVHLVDAEKPKGEWNTLELITFNGNSIYVVNGQVVMRLYNAQRSTTARPNRSRPGKSVCRRKAANVISAMWEVQPITEIPAEFAEKKM